MWPYAADSALVGWSEECYDRSPQETRTTPWRMIVKRILFAALAVGSIVTAIAAESRAADEKKPEKSTAAAPAASSAAKAPAKGSTAATPAKTPAVVDSLGMLEKAVARDSSKFDNLYRLGVMYLDHDRIPEATRVFDKAHRLKPKDAPTMVNLGVALDASGKPDAAQAYYRQALVSMPGDSVATCRLASSLYAQAKYPDAMNLLRETIANKPKAHCAYFTLGVAFADAGIYRDAIRMWKKVVALAPDSPEAASANESIDVLEKYIRGQQ